MHYMIQNMAVCNLYENVDKSNVPIHTLPIEIVARIINHLSLSDILSLACVSKIWRCHYVNQNVIWMNICEKMNIRELDYTKCFSDLARNNTECKGYFETNSIKLFGPFCAWWSVYNRYIMVLKNIEANDFSTIHVKRRTCNLSYCTDDYIITVNRYKKYPIEATLLKNTSGSETKIRLKVHSFFKKLISVKDSVIKIVGNKKYLVFEIRSNLFIYAIEDGTFVQRPYVMVSKPELNDEQKPECLTKYLEANNNSKISIDNEHLAVVLPNKSRLIVYDLASMRISRDLIYCQIPNTVQCLKYDSRRVMIGITFQIEMPNNNIPHCQAIIYHWDQSNIPFKVSIFGPVTEFKTTPNLIGVQNEAPETPFIAKISNIYKVFWIDCDTFSIDSTRKFIYYNINSSLFKYDLNKSLSDNFEVTQKIALEAISIRFSLLPINDRFLILRSTHLDSYDIFDVKDHIVVRSIQLNSGYSLVHVGKLSLIFSNSKEFIVIGFL